MWALGQVGYPNLKAGVRGMLRLEMTHAKIKVLKKNNENCQIKIFSYDFHTLHVMIYIQCVSYDKILKFHHLRYKFT